MNALLCNIITNNLDINYDTFVEKYMYFGIDLDYDNKKMLHLAIKHKNASAIYYLLKKRIEEI